jgi:uncharacterized protein YndB with AHSA1/START domain
MGVTISHLNVRRSSLIRASRARVWQEFETFERIAAWFGKGHELHQFEPRLGEMVEMSVEIDGEKRHFGGRVLVWEPEREVTLGNNWHGEHAWPVPTFFTFRLTGLYDETLVELFHHGFERLGADAADLLEGFEDGWDTKHLKALREIVE